MKAGDLREKSDEELLKELATQREALFRLRVRQETDKTENPAEPRKVRKDIARILTVLKGRRK